MSTARGPRHGTPTINTTGLYNRKNSTTPTGPPSPIKISSRERQELGLSLKQVIGTTCQSVSCFDHLSSTRSFAYTAGAAAVVATVDSDNTISQRFFRANPTQASQRAAFATGLAREGYASPDSRYRSPVPPKEPERLEWSDSPTGNKSSNIRERVKAATAVSFSPNGRFLAVGETGYKPRVLVFSLNDNALPDSPVAVICEHTFGVQAVAFSPDSKYLASLGTINDGFLFVWAIDERTNVPSLVASNKCTNSVKQMTWMGSSLITVGLRFIKVWRPNDLPASVNENSERGLGLYNRQHKPLAGRNTLLGDLLEATFTCVAAFSDTKAIVCTDGGDVCILDDTDKNQRLLRVANVEFSIMAACLAPAGQVVITGQDGNMKVLDLNELMRTVLSLEMPPGPCGKSPRLTSSTSFVAIGAIGETIVTVDNHHGIQLRSLASEDDDREPGHTLQRLPAHSDAVLGVRALSTTNKRDITFMTWSANGTIIFWSAMCQAKATVHVPMDQSVDMYNIINELKTVVAFSDVSHVLTGDKYGVLRITDVDTGHGVTCIRAHSSEITDIAVYENSSHTLVASSGRDRMVQLFSWKSNQLNLLQTLDEHAGSVTSVLFAKDGNQLLSCSADRTVVVREPVERYDGGPPIFVIVRTINLKNSPTCMRLSLFDDVILLSATDRCIHLIATHTGKVLSSFKANDMDGGDAVIMSSLVHLPATAGSPIIAGVASSDKSVRMYSEDGTLLARDWGHTEGVTDIALLNSQTTLEDITAAKLVTVAADGTVFIWATVPERPRSRDSDPNALQVPSFVGGAPCIVSAQQPLRKVISHSEIARYQRSKSIERDSLEPPSSPTSGRGPPGLKKKSSRLSVRAPRLEPSSRNTIRNGPTSKGGQRSPTPPSPKLPPSPRQPRSAQGRHRLSISNANTPTLTVPDADKTAKENGKGESANGFGSVAASTEQLSRMLKAYRQKLDANCTAVPGERFRELEKELQTTTRMVQKLMVSEKKELALDESLQDLSITDKSLDSVVSRSTSSQDASFLSAQAHQDEEVSGGAETR